MTRILSWNIQYAVGMDGKSDVSRVARELRAHDPDIICLQEVTRHWPELDGGKGADQVSMFADLFPGFALHYGVSVETRRDDGKVAQFGNLILSRLPVVSAATHLLPRPPERGIKHMRRSLAEIVTEDASGPLRVGTVHLEFSSENQRFAQVARIRELHAETCGHLRMPPKPGPPGKPFALPLAPRSVVLCGDFNCGSGAGSLHALGAPFADDTPRLVDAWPIARGRAERPPTCNLFLNPQDPQPPDMRDYIFVSEDIAASVTTFGTDLETTSSDHQPIWIDLGKR